MSLEMTLIVLAWIAILLLGLAMAGILRQLHGIVSARQPAHPRMGPLVGKPAPPLERGPRWGPRGSVLLFVDAECVACGQVLPEYGILAHSNRNLQFLSVFREERNGLRVDKPVEVLTQQGEAFERYQVRVTPLAVAVGSDGRVLDSEPIGSVIALRYFVARATERAVDDEANA